ncbi:MAG: HAD family hydrolase [Elusimicrobiota bacterium]
MAAIESALQKSEVFILDFDGTLVDSNSIKLNAFNGCFLEFLQDFPGIIDYCHSNHHTPRWIKFKHVYENILKRPYNAAIEQSLMARYEALTTKNIIKAPMILSADKFLKWSKKNKRVFLVSSTPTDILIQILKGRNMFESFEKVQGAPVKKSEYILSLSKELKTSVSKFLFWGDTLEDLNSAKESNCPFVGVVNEDLKNEAKWWVPDFSFISKIPQRQILKTGSHV